MTRVAAVDCGTNTTRLLVLDPPGVLARETRVTRLGAGVDATGSLAEPALRRTFAVLDEYAALARAAGVERVRCCATSAVRDAANGAELAAGVRARLGVRPEVLTGEEEAALAFAGAVGHRSWSLPGPVLVVDIGGGSTELALGDHAPVRVASVDVGAVRMHERHLRTDPPTTAEVAACAREVDAALDAALRGWGTGPAEARSVVGVAGTVLTVAAAVLGLGSFDPGRVDAAELPVTSVHDQVRRLLAMPVAVRAALPFMEPGREDVIGAGALILDRVLRRTRVTSVLVSETDILDGIAWSLLPGPAPTAPGGGVW